jgi:cytochrome b561
MPDVYDMFGDPERNNRTRLGARLAHWLVPAATIIYILNIVRYFPYQRSGFFGTISAYVVIAGTVIIIIGLLHLGVARICIRCMESVPPDAPVRAQRQKWLLRYAHAMNEKRYLFAIIGYNLIGWFLVSWLFPVGPDNVIRSGWIFVPVDLALLLMAISLSAHHRMSPWCPYCRGWDDGGMREPSPDPDTSGLKKV